MSVEAYWGNAAAAGESAVRQRRQRAFQAARRHSRRVRWLRMLLPLAGATAVVAIVVVTRLNLPGALDLSIAGMSVTRNSIIMDKPRLTGFDRDKRKYSVTADRAIQLLGKPTAVRMERVRAEVTVEGRGTTSVVAAAGDYDNAAGRLALQGGIAVQSSDGYSLALDDAQLDFKAGTMESANPIRITFNGSETTAGSVSARDGGKHIVLKGAVRTTILPPRAPADDAAPAPGPTP